MTIRELDACLSRLHEERQDGAFAEFCLHAFESSNIPDANLASARMYLLFLDRVLGILSGGVAPDDEAGERKLQSMKECFIDGRPYASLSEDVFAAAEVISGMARKDIAGSGMEAIPGNVAMSIGIQCYGAVLMNARLRAEEFRELFVLSWCRYYSEA